MSSLILVRHGETDWNRAGRIQGLTDIPLNDTGRAQAREAADRLRAELTGTIPDAGRDAAEDAVIVSSDLQRASETADIIAAALGLGTPRRYPGLRERAYGEAEGLVTAEFQRRWGHWHIADVPGAETRADLRARAIDALLRVRQDASVDGTIPPLIAVAHGALIREVIGHATQDRLPEPGVRLPNGSLHRFDIERGSLRLMLPVDLTR
ncbi:histidine phosphatase family protein [Microbacterium sp. ET2]|uniref:histidine phosphatase family protein n=1 Tax=Microbacterium albipurpureum TaxID=3050384 RepID=UPI00259C6912|nr:histidine phosphatase family protein [Microbacterium sp. ET2 (Ac-2212)]WJL95494.1 histidine phosphatase family protein [Microbacterium sp. ET2 (Ac-2212)]